MIAKKNQISNVLEIYYYYHYFVKYFLFFFLKNKNIISVFSFFNLKILFLLKNINKILLINHNAKHINKYLNFNIHHKFNKFDLHQVNDHQPVKKFFFSEKNSIIEYKLFNLFFLFNYSLFNSNFKFNYNFKIFYIYNYSNKIVILDSTKFLLR